MPDKKEKLHADQMTAAFREGGIKGTLMRMRAEDRYSTKTLASYIRDLLAAERDRVLEVCRDRAMLWPDNSEGRRAMEEAIALIERLVLPR